MAKIGMPQLNIPPKKSPDSTPSKNLAQAPRATGGTFSSRDTSIFGPRGKSFGSLTSTNYGIQADRENFATRGATASYNLQRLIDKWDRYQLPKYDFTPNYKFNDSQDGMDSMTKMMMYMQLANVATQGIAGIAEAAKSGKSEKAATTSKNADGKGGVQGDPESSNNDSLMSSLDSATSFWSINNIKETLNTKLDGFNTSYTKCVGSYMSEITSVLVDDVKMTLITNGINLNTDVLTPQELNINKDSDSNTLQSGIATIGQDIAEVDKFIEDMPNNLQKLSTKLQSVEALLKTADDSTSPAKNELDSQKKQLESAQTALKTVLEQAGNIRKELLAQQEALTDLKKTHDNIADKEYNLAVEQDKEYQKTEKELTKKKSEIEKAKSKLGNNPDGKAIDKYNKLVADYNALVRQLGTLKVSLSSAGNTEFTNSKGQTYKLQFKPGDNTNFDGIDFYKSATSVTGGADNQANSAVSETPRSNHEDVPDGAPATTNQQHTASSNYMQDANGDYTPVTYKVGKSTIITVKKEALGTKYFDANGKEIDANTAKILLKGATPTIGDVSLSGSVPSFQSSDVQSSTQAYISGPDAKAKELGTTTENLKQIGVEVKFNPLSNRYVCYQNGMLINDALVKNLIKTITK